MCLSACRNVQHELCAHPPTHGPAILSGTQPPRPAHATAAHGLRYACAATTRLKKTLLPMQARFWRAGMRVVFTCTRLGNTLAAITMLTLSLTRAVTLARLAAVIPFTDTAMSFVFRRHVWPTQMLIAGANLRPHSRRRRRGPMQRQMPIVRTSQRGHAQQWRRLWRGAIATVSRLANLIQAGMMVMGQQTLGACTGRLVIKMKR
jgi:hypothetical protein